MIHLLLLFLFIAPVIKADSVHVRHDDKVRIIEAFRIADQYRNQIWKDWDKTPFALLLVTDDHEFLINHPLPSEDFEFLEHDAELKGNIYVRNRVFNTNLLATFPAVNGISTIVVGTPENTGTSSSEWIITILHEHFHQYQYSYPGYYESVNDLDLSGGDETGMWMLNYPFSYEDDNVNMLYDASKNSLAEIFENGDPSRFDDLFEAFKNNRMQFVRSLSEKDYWYFSFQIWQEGIARYTELKQMQLMLDDGYEFSTEVQLLKDYKPLKELYTDYYAGAINTVNKLSLKEDKRICFYAFGALEGLLLDKVNPGWKDDYFTKIFYIEKHYP
jgi:hypothetical protein